jgi:signal peptidase II
VALRYRKSELLTAGGIVALDQVTKALVRNRLDLHESVTVIGNLFDLTRVHNTGAAFGLLNAADFPFKTAVLALIGVTALAALAFYAGMLPADQRLARGGLSLVLGGAAGNLIDRLTFGHVVDFVDVYWRGWHFWAFNVADASITIGVGLMILDLLQVGRQRASRAV